jgi:hypothetical protein
MFDVELMIICLRRGAWLNGADWHPYVRYTIAKRLNVRKDLMFIEGYSLHVDEILDYQLNGGTIKTRDHLRKMARMAFQRPSRSKYDLAMSKFLTSITSDHEEDTLTQPLHWIRTAIMATESNMFFGMNLYTSEMHLQKMTLCRMLNATIGSQ